MKGLIALLLLLQVTAVHSGSHSLWGFATLIYGETQFPEFSGVVMVDDVQVLYYDSNERKLILRLQQNSEDIEEDTVPQGALYIAEAVYAGMKRSSQQIKFLNNHTEGVHVYQKLAGCVLDNDKESKTMEWDAYDGMEAMSYNMQNYTFNPLWPVLMFSQGQIESILMVYTNIYQPICTRTLKHYLNKVKNVVLRKERPRVRLLHNTHPETGEVRVSCLATGFYPRHINLTMLRDGHPIPEEELILGAVLSNGDGTYQLRRTLSVGAEELRERHHYTCSVTHLTLDNKLDISWERPRVRLLHNTHPETGEMRVSCLATGFYPRHINLTMLRDGHPIPEEELILGALLPNGDGTYQVRRTLSVGAEELRERHHYTCSVTHLTLDNKLDIGWGTMEGLTALLFLLQATAVHTGSHSLWGIVTLIYGETQFPEFSGVLMLDDVPVLYYDSNNRKVISRLQQISKDRGDDYIHEAVQFVTERIYNTMKRRSHQIKSLNNHTEGVHVYQRLAGCVLDNDKERKTMERDAYDGTEASSYNMWNYTFNPLWPVLMFSQGHLETILMEYTNIYQPICIQTLKYYLNKVKNVVLRKERPRVRLLHNTHPKTGEMRVSCLATGFYPRHINLTMLRDGHPIPEEELILGDVLPNGDGTYQLRRTLSVGAEELRERHHYTCSVTHLTLDNKLDIGWEPDDGPNITIIIIVVVVLLLVILVILTVFIKRRRERPRVRLLHNTHPETGEVKLSCLATGFYPRHINLTMLRDGHPIPEEELILGDLLPNGDGTYQ
ncbi:hypothetical protein JZ751_003265, partial [Albula glossodonta]